MAMKKILLMLLVLMVANDISAQDIQITKFERDIKNLKASTEPVYDRTGEVCALIRFLVRDNDFTIEPNMGMMKQEKLPGEIRIYVPKGTKRLTVRKAGYMPLTNYEIPVSIDSKVTYFAELSITDEALKREKANKGHNVYIGLGYNVASISGPSVALGFDIKHHVIELGAVFGINKTDGMYFYGSDDTLEGGDEYKATRIQLRYGYDIRVSDFFSIMPQVGGAYNSFSSSEVANGNGKYEAANSFSAIGAIRMVVSCSNRFKLHITPEYNVGLNKSKTCKLVSDYDSKFKSWSEGFNLNIGLKYYF